MRRILTFSALLSLLAWGLTSLNGCASHTELGGRRMGATANWAPPPGEPSP